MSTVHELVLAASPRLVDGEEVPLAERVHAVAALLSARGFGHGDVLAIQAPNIAPWLGVALGAMAAGGTVTGMHPAASEREVAAQLRDSGASIVVATPALVAAARAAGARDVLAIGPELLAAAPSGAPPRVDPGEHALLLYSSGTTGVPHGVALSHRNVVAGARQVQAALGYTERDVVLAVAPFFHVMGFVVTGIAPLAAGATLVTLPRFDFEALLAAVERHRVTVLAVPPPVMAALARAPITHDLRSLELIVCGGAPLSAAVHAAVAKRFPHAAVGQGYGLTETAAAVCGPRRDAGTVPGSVGKPMRDTEIRLVDGELWVRGPQVHVDGWLPTGDLARIDDDGNVFVVDRVKDLIKVNAYQVAPAELEALLAEHPQVADAAVIGRPDERTGEAPVAFVVARGPLDTEEVRAWVAERVAPYKRLADVRVVDALPRTPAGKLLRRALYERTATTA